MRNKLFLTLGVAAMASMSQAVIVLDQIPVSAAQNNNAWNSQDYEVAENPKDINYIDNFTVNSSQVVLTQIDAAMTGFSGFSNAAGWANVTGFRVEIYSSTAAAGANLTGNVASLFVAPGSTTFTNLGFPAYTGADRIIHIPVNIVLPGAGTYWIGVMGVLNATANNNQIGVLNNTVVAGGNNAVVANPNGGWGFGGTMGTGDNAGYRIAAVPEPGSMIALGLGAAALVARKRRKAA